MTIAAERVLERTGGRVRMMTPATHGIDGAEAAPERLVLMGFMGSGKTTVGRLLAAELRWEFLDVDELVEQRSGLTVAMIFATEGEAAFRKRETAALAVALGHPHAVIALGGGAPETVANRLLLEQTPGTAVVYLSAPFGMLLTRCEAAAGEAAVRPVMADAAMAEARYAARVPLYQRLAHVVVDVVEETPQATMARVLEAIPAGPGRT